MRPQAIFNVVIIGSFYHYPMCDRLGKMDKIKQIRPIGERFYLVESYIRRYGACSEIGPTKIMKMPPTHPCQVSKNHKHRTKDHTCFGIKFPKLLLVFSWTRIDFGIRVKCDA